MGMFATWLPVLLLLSVVMIVLALGLDATAKDTTYLFRHPGLLFRSVASMYVVVPLVATLVVLGFRLNPVVALAIMLISVSPIPPVLPVTQRKLGGHQRYVLGLLVAVSVLAIALVPLALIALSHVFSTDAYLPPAKVARVVLLTVLLPLAAGIAIGHAAPEFAKRAGPGIARVGTLLLLLSLLPILVASWPKMMALVGNGSLLAIAVVFGVGLIAGHLLGGPDPDDRSALALASMTRHPGIALAIAKVSFPDVQVGAAILLYLLVSLVLGLPYRRWMRKKHAAAAAPAQPA